MKSGVGAPVLATLWLCWVFVGVFCQDPTDIDHGCYSDNHERAMTDAVTCSDRVDVCHEQCAADKYCESKTAMTIDFCRTFCRNRNLRYYGLEAGSQCFCGGAVADPFRYGAVTNESECQYPCTGDTNQTCGGEFKVHIYEFKEPVQNSVCFHPGFVSDAFVSSESTFAIGDRVNFICKPLHAVVGDAELVCQSEGEWSPDALPSCNYTGVIDDATTVKSTTTVETTTAEPLTGIMEYLPYIIGGAVGAAVLLVLLCVLCLYCRRRRSRSGGAGQDIRLKPETAPVTFINAGFHTDDAESADSTLTPEVLAAGPPQLYSPGTENRRYEKRLSTFTENPLYENSNETGRGPGSGVDGGPPSPLYANGEVAAPAPSSPLYEDNLKEGSAPPSPLYANGEAARYAGEPSEPNLYVDGPTAASPGPSSPPAEEPTFYPTTGARRAKKNATGTKDLVGWSRPSSLYQRTTLNMEDEDEVESNEDNTTVSAHDLSQAIYAQVDKSRRSESQENLTSNRSGNSFFKDPAKSSATRL